MRKEIKKTGSGVQGIGFSNAEAKKDKLNPIPFLLLLILILSGCSKTHKYYETTYYAPDFSPDGKKIACVKQMRTYTLVEQTITGSTDYVTNEKFDLNIISYDLATGDTKLIYDLGGGTVYDLDWYPNQNILIGSTEQLIILNLDANYNFVSRQNLYFGNTTSFLRARWNYDGTMIGVETSKSDSPVWILDTNGNIIEKTNNFGGVAWAKNENIIAMYSYKVIVYDSINKKYKYFNVNYWPENWINSEKILLYKGYILNTSDSTISKIDLYEYAQKPQVSPNSDRLVIWGGHQDVMLYNIDGTGEQTLLQHSKVELPQ